MKSSTEVFEVTVRSFIKAVPHNESFISETIFHREREMGKRGK
jgi:hypothetical protein